ncbi:E3 ubiquitin-protein ligase pellino homolog 1-like [Salvelinus sp. IW2-2015]|uniref:E3 ubiquitin-protein ligase pellino homolog 1-like n=1 Tax=Salvelinus sp. IW2-2015 TaxID=2691554 RepID=UPI0038D49649
MFSPDQENISTTPASTKVPVKYGELIVLGYNGSLPNGDRGRRKSRFALCRRPKASGVKPSTVHVACTPQAAKAISNKDQHSISYTLSRAQTVVVEYTHDSNTDMFQIGRSTESPIDFVVTDTVPGSQQSHGGGPDPDPVYPEHHLALRLPHHLPAVPAVHRSHLRRRLRLLQEHLPGVKGSQVEDTGRTDGRADHEWRAGDAPSPRLHAGLQAGRVERDLFVCGKVFTLRETRSAQQRGKMVGS